MSNEDVGMAKTTLTPKYVLIDEALTFFKRGLDALNDRTKDRLKRNVEGLSKP